MRQSIAQQKMTNDSVLAHRQQGGSQRFPLPKPDPGSAAILRDELQAGGFEGLLQNCQCGGAWGTILALELTHCNHADKGCFSQIGLSPQK